MSLLMAEILATVFIHLHVVFSKGDVYDGANAKQFGILCDVYNVAAHPPDPWNIEATVNSIKAEIDTINASLSEDTWYDDILKADSSDTVIEKLQFTKEESSKYWSRWRKAVEAAAKGTVFQKLPSTAPPVKKAQAKMRKIEEQMEKILGKIKLGNSDEAGTIKKNFEEAIYGDGKKEADEENKDKAVYIGGNSDRKIVCGKPTDAAKGGASLVLDFLCLCGKHGSGRRYACGKDVDVGSGDWGPNDGTSGKETWQALKKVCREKRYPGTTKAAVGFAALRRFLEALAVGADSNSNTQSPGLFGTCSGNCASSNGCSGQYASTNGICVYYGPKDDNWKQLGWLRKMETGLELLNQTEHDFTAVQHDIGQLRVLQRRAEEIYEEAKTTLELEKSNPTKPTQNHSQGQSSTTSTDKATAQEPNVVNSANAQRFILPWTLLL